VDKEPDAAWVWNTLVPACKGWLAGSVSVMWRSRRGRVVNIERGSGKPSARWSSSQTRTWQTTWRTLKTFWADDGIQEGTYRVLPLKVTPVDKSKVPTRISMLTTWI